MQDYKRTSEEDDTHQKGLLQEDTQQVVLNLPDSDRDGEGSSDNDSDSDSEIYSGIDRDRKTFAVKSQIMFCHPQVSDLLKTILTSATLISPVLSMKSFHSWISYSSRSALPEKKEGIF